MLVSGPDLPKPHSGKKLDGDGRRASETNRLGKAEIGVSILLLLAYALLFCAAAPGGGGLANGFGGPWAPALRIAPAEGDGGGKTTPEWFVSGFALAGVSALLPAESRESESAVVLPLSEFSLGICTFSCGRFDWPLFVRVGGLISLEIEEIDCVRDVSARTRGGGGGGITGLVDLPSFKSSCIGSGLMLVSLRGDSFVGGPNPKCRANTDPRSSMGVKMLRDLDESDL